jgi:hypothetical protein
VTASRAADARTTATAQASSGRAGTRKATTAGRSGGHVDTPTAGATQAATGRVGTRKAAAALAATAAAAAQASALAAIGLQAGEAVRFRRVDRARWQPGVVSRLERDGSVGVTDSNGGAQAVTMANLQVQLRSRRRAGATVRWEPLADRLARAEQLTLL